MAEENQNNSTQNSNPATGVVQPTDNKNVKKDAQGVNLAESKANSVESQGKDGTVKKVKTEKQIMRERERRRRRRQKKKTEVQGVGGERSLKAGQDVPLVTIKETGSNENLKTPPDAKLVESPESGEFPEPKEVVFPVEDESEAEEAEELSKPPEVPAIDLPPAVPSLEAPPEPEEDIPEQEEHQESESVQPEAIEPAAVEETDVEPVEIHEDEVIAPPLPEPVVLDESQKVFEESPSYESDTEEETQPHEEHLEKSNQDKAREIHDSLLNENDHLDELPVKQGLMGRFFDKLAELVQGKKSTGLPESMTKPTEQTIIKEVDGHDVTESSGLGGIIANILKIVVAIVLIVGAFWLGSSLKVVDRIGALFSPSKGTEELVVGDNSQVTIDSELLRKWGFITAQLMGENLGNSKDMTYNVFFNANYFGKLMDPIFYGETGVSAAIYYGFGRDVDYAQNKFIYYVHYLSEVVNANSVKIDDVLKKNVHRDVALNDYIAESQKIFDEGNTLRKEINVQIDDLKVSLNSLTPDKTRYETDFFASMDVFDGEKANNLLTKFIQTAQTEAELKAKSAAMNRLSQNYETELVKLKLRIDAVNSNKDALVSGVKVTETPGGGLDLIKP